MTLFVVRLGLTLWAILVFRLTLGPKIAIAEVQPDLAAALIFYLTLIRGPTLGIVAGFVLGLLIDVDDPAGVGLTSLAWCTAMLFVLVLLAETIRALLISGLDPTRFGLIWIRWGVPTALYTAVAVPLLIAAVRALLGGSRWLRGEP